MKTFNKLLATITLTVGLIAMPVLNAVGCTAVFAQHPSGGPGIALIGDLHIGHYSGEYETEKEFLDNVIPSYRKFLKTHKNSCTVAEKQHKALDEEPWEEEDTFLTRLNWIYKQKRTQQPIYTDKYAFPETNKLIVSDLRSQQSLQLGHILETSAKEGIFTIGNNKQNLPILATIYDLPWTSVLSTPLKEIYMLLSNSSCLKKKIDKQTLDIARIRLLNILMREVPHNIESKIEKSVPKIPQSITTKSPFYLLLKSYEQKLSKLFEPCIKALKKQSNQPLREYVEYILKTKNYGQAAHVLETINQGVLDDMTNYGFLIEIAQAVQNNQPVVLHAGAGHCANIAKKLQKIGYTITFQKTAYDFGKSLDKKDFETLFDQFDSEATLVRQSKL